MIIICAHTHGQRLRPSERSFIFRRHHPSQRGRGPSLRVTSASFIITAMAITYAVKPLNNGRSRYSEVSVRRGFAVVTIFIFVRHRIPSGHTRVEKKKKINEVAHLAAQYSLNKF